MNIMTTLEIATLLTPFVRKGSFSALAFNKWQRDNPELNKTLNWHIDKNYNGLKVSEVYHLSIQNIDQALRCRHASCNNIVHKDRLLVNKDLNFGFQRYCSRKCADSSPERKQKMIDTWTERYGGFGFASASHTAKATATMKKLYGVEFYVVAPNFEQERQKTLLEKTGYAFPMQNPASRLIHQNNMFAKYGVRNSLEKNSAFRIKALQTNERKYGNKQIMATTYMRTLKESKGIWLPEISGSYMNYRRLVMNLTFQSRKLLDKTLLRKVARAGTKNAMHVDHKCSIFDGFRNNVPAEIIASVCNLEIISAKSNGSKGRNSSVSLESLYEAYSLLIS